MSRGLELIISMDVQNPDDVHSQFHKRASTSPPYLTSSTTPARQPHKATSPQTHPKTKLPMAALLLARRPTSLLTLAATSTLILHPKSPISILQSWQKPLLCETFAPASSSSSSRQTPLLSSAPGSRGGLNPAAVKQITWGSILGLASGLAISTFSRSLAVVLGLLIVSVQVSTTAVE